ncbi:hypothetical protein J2Q11_13825 [Tenacibaculum finnmarkense genomovar finnmarkense]|uniref:hypothetical protein n=1 Tax=Tenacibaculum finnmarkense TaxID=2781243 RepID=UPI00187B338A|nr:hypothetical protein [Tenacibaculum finnmarkense]MCD8435941.1 hypothetical protein [Tenacibaculum dicentrarchi]MBE7646776.1 hypothetical protein [Tenacibaculum finnmarkense genomovar ulcerans]MBE7689018.1 hypothetical protein [Tenacibaculum finnmarkense genomovar ulcerans]MCD8403878.1 hypothetical protein [Tenacibaculum finnmarkense genomovar finnmarkense]MCD8418820.1 hypothetical protein [Tenacibaculum finnmarkense genomovar finnmarkense]
MIFAEINYKGKYEDFHSPILNYIQENFERVNSGIQDDSWIWIYEGKEKVAIDTFSSMSHQVKADTKENSLVRKVIKILSREFNLFIYPQPELEQHE